ncbi:uncharacterized protein LOC113774387 isoform X2 [Coffea eugenioides]|uniref:uncharacterized protein LOC113774387 isoform X2 n=1 Tax=Coffea eugenioides TaxID=49369 RepID=UPI000F5D1F72|nr:uncharacterized protein LOC113694622 isoform X2 [Coffea arabica]XP_027174733.1 uncharacterized protein LOC113774387 isoform X2 [Coffea eugenioides]
MEFRPCIAAAGFLLFLLLTPCLSRGMQKKELDIYEIDYRGPETHSYLPPPNRSNGRHNIHHQNVNAHSKSKDFRVVRSEGKGKKIHD